MAEMVRVVLVPKDADAEAAANQQIILDLARDPGTNESPGPFPAFGRVGDFNKPETLYPFTLMKDGRMDYGSYATEEQRQDMFDVRTARLVVGEEVAYRTGGGSHTYVVTSVTPL